MNPGHPLRLALVDDDDGARSGVSRLLRCMGHHVHSFESAEAFELAHVEVDCLIVDVRLPGVSGLELRDRLRERGNPVPVVFITGDTLASALREFVAASGRPVIESTRRPAWA